MLMEPASKLSAPLWVVSRKTFNTPDKALCPATVTVYGAWVIPNTPLITYRLVALSKREMVTAPLYVYVEPVYVVEGLSKNPVVSTPEVAT
jgi:hypothetical protein